MANGSSLWLFLCCVAVVWLCLAVSKSAYDTTVMVTLQIIYTDTDINCSSGTAVFWLVVDWTSQIGGAVKKKINHFSAIIASDLPWTHGPHRSTGLSLKVSLRSVCLPNWVTESAELHHDLIGEVSQQPPAHNPAVILQLSLMTDPLPHLTHTQTRTQTALWQMNHTWGSLKLYNSGQ